MRRASHVLKEADIAAGRQNQKAQIEQRAMAANAEVKSIKDRLFHRDIEREAKEHGLTASQEEVKALSERFNDRLAKLCDGAVGAAESSHGEALLAEGTLGDAHLPLKSWYALFKHIDADGSGSIDFVELTRMVRDGLALPGSSVSERQLKGLWVALDKDGSGLISAGEFGQFMRLGEPKKLTTLEERRAHLASQTRAAAESMRVELRKRQLSKVAARTHEYNARMAELAAELAKESGGNAEAAPEAASDNATTVGVTLPPLVSAARSEPSPRAKPAAGGGRTRVHMGGVQSAYASITPAPGQRVRMSLPPTRADHSPRGAGIPLRRTMGPL
jgi:Ca2+-binding EF-hand superfamily protein